MRLTGQASYTALSTSTPTPECGGLSWFQRQRQSISSSFFPKTVSCILGWPQPCYATEDDLEYPIPLPSFPSAKIIGVHHHTWFTRLGMEPRALYILGKHSTD